MDLVGELCYGAWHLQIALDLMLYEPTRGGRYFGFAQHIYLQDWVAGLVGASPRKWKRLRGVASLFKLLIFF
jgi:hypothetical protein